MSIYTVYLGLLKLRQGMLNSGRKCTERLALMLILKDALYFRPWYAADGCSAEDREIVFFLPKEYGSNGD